jgi:hypothetical protein
LHGIGRRLVLPDEAPLAGRIGPRRMTALLAEAQARRDERALVRAYPLAPADRTERPHEARLTLAKGSDSVAVALPLQSARGGDRTVVRAREARARTARPPIPLIDREHELAELRAALEAARAGHGGTVLVGGEPGIGKTRLASVLAAEAEARDVPVWWGRGWEDGSAPAFWPWNTALRRWIDRAGRDAIARAAEAFPSELAHVFPVLRETDSALAIPAIGDSDRGARFRLFDVVSRFLVSIAEPDGLVVVLDDLHWADRASLRLLEFVAAGAADTRLLVVATYRDTEVRREDPLFATLSALGRAPSTRRLLIGGLSPEHCARWVDPTGTRCDAAALGDLLHRETNGNPFLVGEIVQLLTSEGEIDGEAIAAALPHGAREVVARRLDRLGAACRTTLAVAALLGDTIDASILTEIVDPAADDHLDLALRDRILGEGEDDSGRYRFAHALIRRVLVDELTPSERAGWHARIAAVLERRAAADEVVTTELVHHFAAAGTAAALRKAFDYACRGAEHATRGLGWEEAVRLYEIALDLGSRSGACDGARSLELRLALARALRGSGDVPATRTRCEEVMAACRRTPRPALLARAALIYVGPMPEFGRIALADRAALEAAYREADALEDGLKARLYARLAGDLIAANEIAQAGRVFALCDEAARAARRAGDAGALAMALLGAYYASALRLCAGDPVVGRRIPSAREVLEAAEAGGEHEIAAGIRHLRAAGAFARGDADRFTAEVDALSVAAAAVRVPDALCLADGLAALRAIVEGRFDEGRDLMDRALATGHRSELPNAFGRHFSQRVLWHLVRGELAEIAPELDRFVRNHPGGTGWEPMRALARLASGEVSAARAELHTLLARGFGPAETGVMSRCYLAGLALLCTELGDREHAPAIYERVASRKEAWSVDGCHTLGPWSLLLGELARLCDRPVEAARHLENAIEVARRMRARPFIAMAQAALVETRLSLDPTAAADATVAATLAEAEQTASELGLRQVRARAGRLREAMTRTRATDVNRFLCEGEIWSVAFRGVEIRLKDGKGPRYLATLLAAPGHDFHVLELAGGTPSTGSTRAASEGLAVGRLGGLEDAPDARAMREYRARLDDLRVEIDEADALGDGARAERLRGELDLFASQVSQRFGSRARTRGPAETARKAVTKVLRTQIAKLLDAHPILGEHLRHAVKTGVFCSYAPDVATSWDVSFPA